ncbi:hypothetical protein GCM10023340_06500 [Nocardioides marinquilinus]|uniref:Prepilin-type N-terminal cleavage/methylation domain-containing protein n=2 Tax=Nocardioides marinquilinus TaxID=1210400 RepID=A0ABP9PC54_9ACTN
MTLVEVMVALVLFAIMSTAVLNMVMNAQRLTRYDAARVVANNLATRELEIVRDTFFGPTRGPDRVLLNTAENPSPLPGGRVGDPLVVDGIAFTVTRTAEWAQVDTRAASTCDEGSNVELAYLRVRVRVTWPKMGDRPPVQMDTTMTPAKGTYSAFTGHLGLKVIDQLGEPLGGVPVVVRTNTNAVAASGRTSSDGCVLFPFLNAGTYTYELNRAGYVTPAGDPAGKTTVQVQSGQLWRGIAEYAQSATVDVTFTTREGFGLPPANQQIPVSLGNSALKPSGVKAYPGTGNARSLTSLWPYPSGYTLWAGNCLGNDPKDLGDPPVAVEPGQTATTTVRLAPLTVRAPVGTTITAKQAVDSSCPAGATVIVGQVPASGVLAASLPTGLWRLTRSGSSTTRDVTLAPDDPEATAPLPTPPTVTF